MRAEGRRKTLGSAEKGRVGAVVLRTRLAFPRKSTCVSSTTTQSCRERAGYAEGCWLREEVAAQRRYMLSSRANPIVV
eukprot:COSAG04_NODE_2341_length_4295_cov_5.618061_2_plen_78_part_00